MARGINDSTIRAINDLMCYLVEYGIPEIDTRYKDLTGIFNSAIDSSGFS